MPGYDPTKTLIRGARGAFLGAILAVIMLPGFDEAVGIHVAAPYKVLVVTALLPMLRSYLVGRWGVTAGGILGKRN